MMKANELRIGNFILDWNKNIQSASVGDLMNLDEQWKWAGVDKEYYHIPLTEEWLLKLEFEKITDFSWVYDNGEKRFQLTEGTGYFTPTHYLGIVEISFVHQLQNLFFALTGEELKIKETV